MEKIFKAIEEKLTALELDNDLLRYENKKLKAELEEKDKTINTQACILEGMRMQKGSVTND